MTNQFITLPFGAVKQILDDSSRELNIRRQGYGADELKFMQSILQAAYKRGVGSVLDDTAKQEQILQLYEGRITVRDQEIAELTEELENLKIRDSESDKLLRRAYYAMMGEELTQ